MRTVIIGCGYVGKALAEHWQGQDLTLTTTRLEKKNQLERLGNVVILNSADKKKMKAVLTGAMRVVVTVAPKDQNYSTYVETAQSVCQSISKKAHLVYTSSSSIYGECNGEWVTEDSPLKGKRELIEAETLYEQLPHHTILRLAGIYGPGRELEGFAKRASGKELGDSYCNWIHLDDIVRAIDFVFKNKIEGIFNLCEDEHPKRSELYNPIIQKLGLAPIRWVEGATLFGNKRVCNKKFRKYQSIYEEHEPHAADDSRSL